MQDLPHQKLHVVVKDPTMGLDFVLQHQTYAQTEMQMYFGILSIQVTEQTD